MLELALTAHDARDERLGHRDRDQAAVVVVDRLAVMFDPRPRDLGHVAGTATATAGQATVGRPGCLHLAATVNNGRLNHAHVIIFIQQVTTQNSIWQACAQMQMPYLHFYMNRRAFSRDLNNQKWSEE